MKTRSLLIGCVILGITAGGDGRGAPAKKDPKLATGDGTVSCVERPPTASTNSFYPSNRAPLLPSPLIRLPIGAIRPNGWLRSALELEADGLSGRLTELSPWCSPASNAWLSAEGRGINGWEELPYWLKGFGDLGYVLGDERIIKEARRWIDGILSSQQPDGWFGPAANRTGLNGKPDLWPNMIALNALRSFYEFTGDRRVLELMENYFRWELAVPDSDFLFSSWQHSRGGDNLDSVYWLYNLTGKPELLDLAAKIHRATKDWVKGSDGHGVNFSQGFREPAMYYQQGRDIAFLQATERNYANIMTLYGQPGGMFGADENIRPGCTDPRQAAETCSMVEFMRSFEMLARITGNPVWADRCEEVAFNSLPAAQPPDQRGLHYLTGANMAQLDRADHSPGLNNGGGMLCYSPLIFRCCQHNVAQGWPYFAEELWHATSDNGLCVTMCAASEVKARVGDGATVKITEITDYPFDDTMTFTVSTPKPTRFTLYLRVPGWCDEPKLTLNGRVLSVRATPRSFLAVQRIWSEGDRLVLELPMRLRARVWVKDKNAVSIERGPLTYSLKIGENWVRSGGSEQWPEWEVLPTTPWNYGLQIDPKNPDAAIKVIRKPGPLPRQPFAMDAAPVQLRAGARKIPEWTFDRHGLVAVLQQSPARTMEPLETVTLIPMGCARLRISAFPTVTDGPAGHEWKASAPIFTDREASASHTNDNFEALHDGELGAATPSSSGDRAVRRFTWWPLKGTTEWVAYRFKDARRFSWSEVYWVDDTEQEGLCCVPASWRLLWRKGDDWVPVKLADGSNFGAKKDTFNRVKFESVTAAEIRLEVQLPPGFCGGILEWRVGEEKESSRKQ